MKEKENEVESLSRRLNYKEQELQDQEFYLNREQFELNKRESTIKKRESRLDERESNLEAEIDTASEQKIAKEKQRLHDEYTTKLAEDRQNDEITLKEQLEAKKAKLQEEYNKEAIKWDKIKATMPKIVVLIVFLVLIVCCFTYCQNRVRDENKALLEQLENAETNLYRCDGRGVQAYDKNFEEITGFFENTTTTYGGYVYLIEQNDEWSLITDVGVRGDKRQIYVKTSDFHSSYTRVIADLS